MNYHQENKPESKPPAKNTPTFSEAKMMLEELKAIDHAKTEAIKAQDKSPREMIEQAMNAVIMEMMQLRRTLWLVLQQTGPVEVDEAQCHPLWRMKATRLDGKRARLEATQLAEPTKEQIAELAEQLNGTMTPMEQAMERTELRDYPPAYLHMLVLPLVTQNADGYWIDSAFAKVVEKKPPGENN